jgi:hypothetical protein
MTQLPETETVQSCGDALHSVLREPATTPRRLTQAEQRKLIRAALAIPAFGPTVTFKCGTAPAAILLGTASSLTRRGGGCRKVPDRLSPTLGDTTNQTNRSDYVHAGAGRITSRPIVPILPIVPIPAARRGFGTNGTIGTGPIRVREAPSSSLGSDGAARDR